MPAVSSRSMRKQTPPGRDLARRIDSCPGCRWPPGDGISRLEVIDIDLVDLVIEPSAGENRLPARS